VASTSPRAWRERLGYQCVSREELLEKAAERYNVPRYALIAALDNPPGFPEGRSLRRIHHIAHVTATLAKLAIHDDLVYHGQVGHLRLKGINPVLKVRVIADIKYRVAAAMREHHLSRQKAIDFIKTVDRDRSRWVQVMYQADWKDPSQYDIVVDLEQVDVEEACDRAIAALRAAPRLSRQNLEDFALATGARARIAAADAINDTDIEVTAAGGSVTITGECDSQGEMERIVECARDVPGVKEIQSRLSIRFSSAYGAR